MTSRECACVGGVRRLDAALSNDPLKTLDEPGSRAFRPHKKPHAKFAKFAK